MKKLRIGCAPDTFLGARLQTCRGIGLIDMVLALAENRPERASGRMALHSLEMMEKMLSGAKTQQFGILETTFDRPQPLPADFPVR